MFVSNSSLSRHKAQQKSSCKIMRTLFSSSSCSESVRLSLRHKFKSYICIILYARNSRVSCVKFKSGLSVLHLIVTQNALIWRCNVGSFNSYLAFLSNFSIFLLIIQISVILFCQLDLSWVSASLVQIRIFC